MENKFTCFISGGAEAGVKYTLDMFTLQPLVERVVLVAAKKPEYIMPAGKVGWLEGGSVCQANVLRMIAEVSNTAYTVLCTSKLPVEPGPFALERILQVATDTGAVILYSDYLVTNGEQVVQHPVNEYQEGSLRDDFNFGPVLVLHTATIKKLTRTNEFNYNFAGLYDLRLKCSRHGKIIRLPEFLFTEKKFSLASQPEGIFSYVDPSNRDAQVEMEMACNYHLKAIGAWLPPIFKDINPVDGAFPVEASVIIPVRNREKTIIDAVNSALSQVAPFEFNVICIDNHSSDSTSTLLSSLAKKNPRLVHLVPERQDLGIGGCWTEGIFHPSCGKFAVQLDSDDLYIDDNVLAKIVDTFYRESCAIVVGSYRLVDFGLNDIPPGLIDHREWTWDNGRNNALRINGLGAPRAFYVPLLREVKIPNTSYGEDYSTVLRISRDYRVGRIYEPLYLCRRWEDNTDARLDVKQLNAFNHYKDKIRSIEVMARIAKNSNHAGLC